MTVIALSGIDGSGKTTLAQSLVANLQSRGHDAVSYYGRFVPGILSALPLVFRRLRFGQVDLESFPPNYAQNRGRFADNPVVRGAFRPLFYGAYTYEIGTTLLRLTQRHEAVVCDRYLLDSWVLDLRLGSKRPADQDLGSLRLLSHLLPSPDRSFLLDVSPEVAQQRRLDNLPRPLLDEAIHDYRLGGRVLGVTFLDASRSIEECCAQVLAELESAPGE